MTDQILKAIPEDEARKFIAESTRTLGSARTSASGTFVGAWQLSDGSTIEHWINFGWLDKFLHVPVDFVPSRLIHGLPR